MNNEDIILEDIDYCEYCYNITEIFICTKCEARFCYDCGAHSSYHYMYDYSCCALCAEQYHYGKNAKNNYKKLLSYNRTEKIKILNTII